MVEFEMPGHYRFGMVADGQDRIIEKYLARHKNGRVLHVGGSSNLTVNKSFSSLVGRVICGDLPLVAKNLVEHKEELPNIIPLAMDVFNIPFLDNSMDLIVAISVYPLYNEDLRTVEKGLRELRRVNSKGGELLVCNRPYSSDSPSRCTMQEYLGLACKVGYKVIERNLAKDSLGETGAEKRYILVMQK